MALLLLIGTEELNQFMFVSLFVLLEGKKLFLAL